jgi:hypothetical protein
MSNSLEVKPMFLYIPVAKTKVVLTMLIAGLLVALLACSGGSNATIAPNPTLAPAENPTSAPLSFDTPAATAAAAQSPAASDTPQATSIPATNAPPSGGNGALDVILNAQRAQMTAKSFRSHSVTTTGDGKTTTIITEYVAPDRLRLTTQASDGGTNDMIIIKGQGTWQLVNGKWTKSGFDLSTTAFLFLDPKNLEQLKQGIDIGQIQLVGADLLDGKPMFVYQYNIDLKSAGAGGTDLKGTYKIWIGATDSRAYKLEGDTDSIVSKGSKVHTLITFEYDVPLTIEPPA